MVRATLTDTRVVGGYFGFGSLAGYSEQNPDLFIAERWILDDDGWFVERADNTDGVWIGHENIVSVEFYKVPDEEAADTPDQQEAADAGDQQGAADNANEQGAVDIADPHDQADTPISRQLSYSRAMPDKRDLPPIEKRGGYSPQSKAPSPAQAPSKPADAAASAKPSNGK